jgi:hypothetical protein
MSDIIDRCRVDCGLLFIDNAHDGETFHVGEVELYREAKRLHTELAAANDRAYEACKAREQARTERNTLAVERDLLRECNAADTAWREGYMLTTPAGIIDALTTRVEQARAALAAFDAAHTTEGDPSTKGA